MNNLNRLKDRKRKFHEITSFSFKNVLLKSKFYNVVTVYIETEREFPMKRRKLITRFDDLRNR